MANRQDILQHLGQQFGLEKDEIEEMLPQFTTAVNEYREDLITCIPTKDLAAISSKSHRIKGACLTLGLDDCVSVASDMERAAKDGDLSYDYSSAMQKLDKLLSFI
ncbi:MAG: Hpt domain-containing protein [Desulfotalea sp.]